MDLGPWSSGRQSSADNGAASAWLLPQDSARALCLEQELVHSFADAIGQHL
jgi:hypothetical protein